MAQDDTPKPGSDPEAAKTIGGKGDFGVPEKRVRDRQYVSANTKQADRGASQARSGEEETEGARVSGAGSNQSGEGSGSGGDVDTDIVGVGTGGSGISASGNVRRPPGPDDSDGSSNEMASGPPAQGRNQGEPGEIGGDISIQGSAIDRGGGDQQTNPPGEGADSTGRPTRAADGIQDDASAGEISSGEARGEDND